VFRSPTAAQQVEREAFRVAVDAAYRDGAEIVEDDFRRFPIPGTLNALLVVAQLTAALAVLRFASRASSIFALVVAAVVFAFVMQAGFCLVHEAVHRKLHANRNVNAGLAIVSFTLFPASYHFFEIAHLVHHRRNRSDAELEDYVLPGEVAWLKRACYYFLICGLFWLLVPLSSIGIALVPRRIRLPAPGEDAGAFRRFAQFLNEVHPWRVRRDLAVAVGIWIAAFGLLELRWTAIAVCYASFAFSWASQQYIYHVRTPRHAVLGALDLALPRPLEVFYLHFNYHLTHHLAVWVPWIYLPRVAPRKPSMGYASTYWRLWTPPQPIDAAWPPRFQASGPIPPRSGEA
jgi:fatty acid desaturase